MAPGVQCMNHYCPERLSGYSGSYVPNTQAIYNSADWMSTLTSLQNEKGYLEGLLSKTVTTLNALRDKQTRNERSLIANPSPRTKKKKIQQNRWRTDKTIKTCEKEEKTVLDCLQVCKNNISTLETIFKQMEMSSTAADCYSSDRCSYSESATTAFDWNGWADEGDMSPFQKRSHRAFSFPSIPPEVRVDEIHLGEAVAAETRRPPRLPPRRRAPPPAAVLPPVPPNSAHIQFHHSTLSPDAACFEPSITHYPHADKKPELDKLSISGLLSS
ncbi:hypothetical protein BDV95DRAFT_606813 [Massariosphaeria phaeospora]|uniref:Uncharacterized protein n=1 Tax=Massariosphaeria phaeospora TaxID=100035 RepID=A0A7C8M9W5_9PLEO|nr:hypothetical protein BDV95DRAFT_606813 [Massariosphaeria phaeospora]